MILIENIRILNTKFSEWSLPSPDAANQYDEVVVENTKSGFPTLKLTKNQQSRYIHSKYDPTREAEIISANLDLSEYEHIIFLGLGLGYHIRSILSKNSHLTYSLYEANNNHLHEFLSNMKLQDLDLENLLLFSNSKRQDYILEQMSALSHGHFPKTFIYTLPTLKVNFEAIELELLELMKENLKMKKTNMVTNVQFQKRWTTNVLYNFEEILKSPPILNSKDMFSGQIAFLVAAGPSLKFEYENLKEIQRNKLGYIYSVGSAINSLISEDIIPDAAFTYDPGEHNQNVFKLLKEKQMDEIPLIFGSTVGYETLEGYPGEKFHFMTSQDMISSYYLSSIQPTEIILDAPSISTISYQLLCKLGFEKIILIGQNFAYLNEFRYSTGIDYEKISNKVSDKELDAAISIPDVHGQNILSTEGFVRMKTSLEHHIQSTTNQVEVINTTLHGAKIEGAEFKPLREVLSHLKKRDEVTFIKDLRAFDVTIVSNRQSNLKGHYKKLTSHLDKLTKVKNQMDSNYMKLSWDEMNKIYIKIDQTLTEIEKNKLYIHFVHPVIRSTRQLLEEGFKKLKYQKDPELKAKTVVDILNQFITTTRATSEELYFLAEKTRRT